MVTITVKRDQHHRIKQVILTGHAGAGTYGNDIVCAAISALSIQTVNSLIALVHIDPEVEVDDIEGGFLSLTLPELSGSKQHDADLLVESFVFSLTQLEEEHKQFIKINTTDF